jgi:5-methylcytosine-specific restriction endonuclease McrA
MPSGVYIRTKAMSAMRKGIHYSPATEFKKGVAPWNEGTFGIMKAWNKGNRKEVANNCKCRVCEKEFYLSFSRIKRGNGKVCSKKCFGLYMRGKRPQMSGENHPNWQGGKTSLYNAIRNSPEDNAWRKRIFERDYYTCQDCGNSRGGNLQAHHLWSFSNILSEFLRQYSQFSPIEDKETLLRLAMTYHPFWDISNGLTLCENCHNKTMQPNKTSFIKGNIPHNKKAGV